MTGLQTHDPSHDHQDGERTKNTASDVKPTIRLMTGSHTTLRRLSTSDEWLPWNHDDRRESRQNHGIVCLLANAALLPSADS
jgi:hypothetical protein